MIINSGDISTDNINLLCNGGDETCKDVKINSDNMAINVICDNLYILGTFNCN